MLYQVNLTRLFAPTERPTDGRHVDVIVTFDGIRDASLSSTTQVIIRRYSASLAA